MPDGGGGENNAAKDVVTIPKGATLGKRNPVDLHVVVHYRVEPAADGLDGGVHVGSGSRGRPAPCYREGDQLVLPGSSIRGALRNRVRIIAGDAFDLSLFGQLGARGNHFIPNRVYVDSAYAEPGVKTTTARIPKQFGKRSLGRGQAWVYKPNRRAFQDNEQFEVAPVDTVFKGSLVFKGCDPQEIAVVREALGIDASNEPKRLFQVGHGKGYNLGFLLCAAKPSNDAAWTAKPFLELTNLDKLPT